MLYDTQESETIKQNPPSPRAVGVKPTGGRCRVARAPRDAEELGAGAQHADGQRVAPPVAHPVPRAGEAQKPLAFAFDGLAVRVVGTAEQPWFVAQDVCTILGIRNVSQALNGNAKAGALGLDDDEKGVYDLYTSAGSREAIIVNESGLYSLIFRSRKAKAKVFRKWVTSEVLPAIRRTGQYTPAPAAPAAKEPANPRPLPAIVKSVSSISIGVLERLPAFHEDPLPKGSTYPGHWETIEILARQGLAECGPRGARRTEVADLAIRAFELRRVEARDRLLLPCVPPDPVFVDAVRRELMVLEGGKARDWALATAP